MTELPSLVSSRTVSPIQSLSPENEGTSIVSAEARSPSPKEEEPWVMFTRHRTHSDAQYEHTEVQCCFKFFHRIFLQYYLCKHHSGRRVAAHVERFGKFGRTG